jgi:hypothetical protein
MDVLIVYSVPMILIIAGVFALLLPEKQPTMAL